jgi:signal transduction histidine kinase
MDTLRAAVDNKQPHRLEVAVRRSDRARFEADMAFSPIARHDDAVRSVVCSLRDITGRKRAEETLRQALQREIEVGEMRMRFLSMASHDLRTPLAVIQAAVDLVSQYGDRLSAERKQTQYDQIRGSIRHMVELLDDVLTIGKMEVGQLGFNPEMLDVAAFSRKVVSDLRTSIGTGHHFDFSVAGTRVNRMVDPSLLRHILYNLLSNAIKYSPEGSTVTCKLACEADRVIFRVSDEGIGIPLADQERLFSAFHRAENVGSVSGTGLGLAIVKQSVERHGGVIVFESQEGVGTTFTVTIPDISASAGPDLPLNSVTP